MVKSAAFIVFHGYWPSKSGYLGKTNATICARGANLYHALDAQKIDTWCVASCGLFPGFSTQKMPLALMQKKALEACGVPHERILIPEENLLKSEQASVDTLGEVDTALRLAREKGFFDCTFYSVCCWHHAFRVITTGLIVMRVIRPVVCWIMPLREVIVEPPKILFEPIRILLALFFPRACLYRLGRLARKVGL